MNSLKNALFSSYRRTATVLVIAVLTLAIPITVTLLGQRQDIRQRASFTGDCTPGEYLGGTYCINSNSCYDVWCNAAGDGERNEYYSGSTCSHCTDPVTATPTAPPASNYCGSHGGIQCRYGGCLSGEKIIEDNVNYNDLCAASPGAVCCGVLDSCTGIIGSTACENAGCYMDPVSGCQPHTSNPTITCDFYKGVACDTNASLPQFSSTLFSSVVLQYSSESTPYKGGAYCGGHYYDVYGCTDGTYKYDRQSYYDVTSCGTVSNWCARCVGIIGSTACTNTPGCYMDPVSGCQPDTASPTTTPSSTPSNGCTGIIGSTACENAGCYMDPVSGCQPHTTPTADYCPTHGGTLCRYGGCLSGEQTIIDNVNYNDLCAHSGSGYTCCLAGTPAPTAPPMRYATVQTYCYNGLSYADFAWTIDYNGWNYETYWRNTNTGISGTQSYGGSTNQGTIYGLVEGAPYTWGVRAYLGSTIGTSYTGNFTAASGCAGVTGTIPPFTPTATATNTPTATTTRQPTATATATNNPTATATRQPTASSTSQPTASSTSQPTATATRQPTATSTPTGTPTPTPTLAPGETGLTIALVLPGIGTDTAKGMNNAPKTPSRAVNVKVFNAQNQEVKNVSGNIAYNAGSFQGRVNLGSGFTTGAYTVKVRLTNTLWKLLPGIITITSGSNTVAGPANLISGDFDQNNSLDISDFNKIISCSRGLADCSAAQKVLADLNDDGVTNDSLDVAILLSNFAHRTGD